MIKSPPTILHVDINSYFASLLQQENPKLRGKPIGVTKAAGRTCIIAASKEAKACGVETGNRLRDARLRCPQLITIPASFNRYLDATQRLKTIFTSVSPDVFIYSLDEAFIDLTHCLTYLYPDALTVANLIQRQIKDELGEWVTCNVGVSHNRFLAKLASEIAPKGSILAINQENKDVYLASTTFKDVCGVGFRLEKKLAVLGISTPYHLRFYTEADLTPYVGPFWARELRKIAYGEEPHLLQLLDVPQPHMKSVGRSITGYRLYDDETEIRNVLLNLIEEVTYKTRRMQLAGRYVAISLLGQNQFWHDHVTLPYYIRHTSQMFDCLYHQLYHSWQRSFKIIRFAVYLGMLKPLHQVPRPLFGNEAILERLSQASDAINQKYGLFTLRSATLLNHDIIRPEVTGFLGDRLYHNL